MLQIIYTSVTYNFIKLVTSRKLDLYEKYSTPSNNQFLYYLKFSDRQDYIIINPFEDNIIEFRIPDVNSPKPHGGATVVYIKDKGLHKKFMQFIIS